jgi:hypothetical protein
MERVATFEYSNSKHVNRDQNLNNTGINHRGKIEEKHRCQLQRGEPLPALIGGWEKKIK